MFYALVASTYIQRIADKYESERAFLPFFFFFSTYSERWHARQTWKGGMVIKLSQTDYLGSLLRSIISDQSFQMEDLDSLDSHRVLRSSSWRWRKQIVNFRTSQQPSRGRFVRLMKSSTNEERKRENRRVEGTRKEDYFNSLSFNSTFVKKEGGRKRDIYLGIHSF